MGLLEPATLLDGVAATRLLRALEGCDESRRLGLGALEPGAVGIVEAAVVQAHTPRTFRRKDGREGTLVRVTLRDATGEADVVLWGGQTALAQSVLLPGAQVRLQGVHVRPGFGGGPPELALDGEVVPMEAQSLGGVVLEGALVLEPTEPVVDGTTARFRAHGQVLRSDGPCRVLLWDGALQAALVHAPGRVRLTAMAPHPALDGLWLSTPATRVESCAAASPGPAALPQP